MQRIIKDQLVKIIAGNNRGKIGKVVRVSDNKVWIEGVNTRERHIASNRLNRQGGKKDVHLPIDISNVAPVIDGKEATSRVAYKLADTGKQRIAKKTGKEIK